MPEQTRTTALSFRVGSSSLAVPSSPGPKCLGLKIPHALHIPASTSAPPTPGSAAPGVETDAASAVDSGIGDDTRPKEPPFVPSDYAKLRRTWENKMRRQYAIGDPQVKVREQDPATSKYSNMTPSVEASKFGRNVVTLSRTKSHFAEGTRPPNVPEMPHPGERI